MEFIRKTFGVPAKRGMRVVALGEPGVIVGSKGKYLRIRINGEKKARNYHPTYQVKYWSDKEGWFTVVAF